MQVIQQKVGRMENLCYLLGAGTGNGTATGTGSARERRVPAICVDPGFEAQRILEAADEHGLRITDILVTHGHPDHIGAVDAVKRATGATVWAHDSADHPIDRKLSHGERVRIAGLDVEVLHTPGHRFDSACFVVGGHLLTGDTLFVGDCGRVDLPGADVRALHHSLLVTLAALPGDLVVLPGHDYGRTPTSTLARERAENHVLRPRTVDEFVRFMAEP